LELAAWRLNFSLSTEWKVLKNFSQLARYARGSSECGRRK